MLQNCDNHCMLNWSKIIKKSPFQVKIKARSNTRPSHRLYRKLGNFTKMK